MLFVKGEVKARAYNIFLIKGIDRGLECYYYILVDEDKVGQFKVLGKDDTADLDTFGKVLKSGYGEPHPKVKEQMAKDYNFQE